MEVASVTRVHVRRHWLLFVIFGLLRCLRWLEEACPVVLSLFLLICLVVCTTVSLVVCHTFCVLVSDGPVTFASRSGVCVQLHSYLARCGVSLVHRG